MLRRAVKAIAMMAAGRIQNLHPAEQQERRLAGFRTVLIRHAMQDITQMARVALEADPQAPTRYNLNEILSNSVQRVRRLSLALLSELSARFTVCMPGKLSVAMNNACCCT